MAKWNWKHVVKTASGAGYEVLHDLANLIGLGYVIDDTLYDNVDPETTVDALQKKISAAISRNTEYYDELMRKNEAKIADILNVARNTSSSTVKKALSDKYAEVEKIGSRLRKERMDAEDTIARAEVTASRGSTLSNLARETMYGESYKQANDELDKIIEKRIE